MKNTRMILLASLLLAFSLTACGGGSQTNGAAGDNGSVSQAGTAGNGSVNGSADSALGTENGSAAGPGSGAATGPDHDVAGSGVTGNSTTPGGGLVDDAREALDDAGRAVRNSVDDAARNF